MKIQNDSISGTFQKVTVCTHGLNKDLLRCLVQAGAIIHEMDTTITIGTVHRLTRTISDADPKVILVADGNKKSELEIWKNNQRRHNSSKFRKK